MRKIQNTCNYCALDCNLDFYEENGRIVKIVPTKGYPVNDGFCCIKGLSLDKQQQTVKPNSLPKIRQADGSFKEVSWDKGFQHIADELKRLQAKYGPESVAGISTGQLTLEEFAIFGHVMRNYLKTNVDGNTRLCMATAVVAHKQSYTTFTQTMSDLSVANGEITFDVTVTNTGSTAGKDVVEVFYNPPYTNGGIEKASANLIDYGKTELLEPGKSQVLTFTIQAEDMASFDELGEGCYVLEQGDYIISVNANSHEILDSKTYHQGSTVVYNEGNPRASDDTAAVARFNDLRNDVTYLSRKDGFANYAQATAAPSDLEMSAENMAKYHLNENFDYPERSVVVLLLPKRGGYQHPVSNRATRYNDNRVSLFCTQFGKCAVTGEKQQIGNIHCHHKRPKHLGGTDEYSNLTLVSEDVHRLIHATNPEVIRKYLQKLNLDSKQLRKLNKLRSLANVESCLKYDAI